VKDILGDKKKKKTAKKCFMKKFMIPMALLLLLVKGIHAQNIVKGIVVDYNSEKPLKNVSVTIKNNSTQLLETNDLGVFILKD